jgi:hypothetical protein
MELLYMKITRQLTTLVGIAALTCSSFSQAVPLYFTFESRAFDPGDAYDPEYAAQYRELMGVSLGDPISYVFLVDNEVTSRTHPDGTVYEYGHTITEDVSASGVTSTNYDFEYYTELVSATGLDVDPDLIVSHQPSNAGVSGGFGYTGPEFPAFYQSPYRSSIDWFGVGTNGSFSLHMYPDVPRTEISSFENFVQWAVDTSPRASNNNMTVYDDEGSAHYFSPVVRLTSVSEAPPSVGVPEPSTLLLMSVGLAGVLTARHKKSPTKL